MSEVEAHGHVERSSQAVEADINGQAGHVVHKVVDPQLNGTHEGEGTAEKVVCQVELAEVGEGGEDVGEGAIQGCMAGFRV